MAAEPDESRLRALLEATVGLTSELSLDALLQRLVEVSAELTGAQYAALGVIDESGQGLERFVTTGMDDETYAAIGDLPRGRGILGVVIRDAHSLRLDDLTVDPRAVGFPPNHPPMRSFLGVPILLRGVSYGNLYFTEKTGGGSFSDEDEEIVKLLAAQAAVAIANARLFESSTRWSRQLETLHEIVRSMVEESDLDHLLDLVCRRLREMIGARLTVIVLPYGDSELRIAAADGEGDAAHGAVGRRFTREGSKSARVIDRQQSVRVDSVIDDPEMDQDESRFLGIRTALVVPLVAR
ncbi:MAG TPA: GAF domain-containing protein, partial [Gaiellaceae bacterium]